MQRLQDLAELMSLIIQGRSRICELNLVVLLLKPIKKSTHSRLALLEPQLKLIIYKFHSPVMIPLNGLAGQ